MCNSSVVKTPLMIISRVHLDVFGEMHTGRKMPGRMHDRAELEGGKKFSALKFQFFTFYSLKGTYVNLYENACIHICTAEWKVGKVFI